MGVRNYITLFLLSFSAFIIVSTEFAPLGVMSLMGESLGASESEIGVSVTIYAWIGTLVALVTPMFLAGINRRVLLAVLLGLIALANYITSIADHTFYLYLARVIGGIANGAFLAFLAITATSIVKDEVKAKATAIAFLGVSFASAFCIVIVNFLSTYLLWQTIYNILSLSAFACGILLLVFVPTLREHSSSKGFALFKKTFENKDVVAILLISVCCITAHFSIYSFVQPWLANTLALEESSVSLLLLCFGVAGFLSNTLLTRYIEEYLSKIVLYAIALTAMCLLLFSVFGIKGYTLVLYPLFVIWGGCVSSLIVCFQALVIKLAKQEAGNAVAIYVSCFNGAIGLGALLGGLLLQWFGIYILMLINGVIVLIACYQYFKRFIKGGVNG
ncbi:MFS transporter [Myroides albus]|nr:MFS transporter [Myroides albus]UVD79060.1 MFS transporter [Myroides albus]